MIKQLLLILLCCPLVVTTALASDFEDNASLTPYNDGWQSADNGNIGSLNFTAWAITTSGSGTATTGSAANVDIGSHSFRLNRPSAGDSAVASRSWTAPAPSPFTVVQIDSVAPTGDAFIRLKEGANDITIIGASSGAWLINDNSGITPLGISSTTPIRVRWILDGDNTYDLQVIDLSVGTLSTFYGRTTIGGLTGSNANTLEFVTDPGSDLLINNINVDSPTVDYRDNAAEGVYSDSWTATPQDSGSAGGHQAWQPWVMTIPGGSSATIASAGDTDVNGVSFVLTNGGGGTTSVVRDFQPPTPLPTTIIQFTAEHSSGAGLIRLRSSGGLNNAVLIGESGGFWTYSDSSGTHTTPFSSTSGIRFSALVDVTTSYDVAVTEISSGITDYQAGRTLSSGLTGDAIGRFVLEAVGTGTLSFNSLVVDAGGTIPVPVEASAIGLE